MAGRVGLGIGHDILGASREMDIPLWDMVTGKRLDGYGILDIYAESFFSAFLRWSICVTRLRR